MDNKITKSKFMPTSLNIPSDPPGSWNPIIKWKEIIPKMSENELSYTMKSFFSFSKSSFFWINSLFFKSRFFNLTDSIESTQDRIAKRNAQNNQSTVKIQIESGNSLIDEFDAQSNREQSLRVDQRYFQGMDYEVGAYNTFR